MKQMVDELIWYIVIANFSSLKDAFLNVENCTLAIFWEKLVGIWNPWFYVFILVIQWLLNLLDL